MTPSLATMRLASASSARASLSVLGTDVSSFRIFVLSRMAGQCGVPHYRSKPMPKATTALDRTAAIGDAPAAKKDTMTGQAQIVIDSVSHMYRPQRGREVLALDQVSLEVANREFVALLGPSGCGKSTLLYLIGGFLPVEKGAILSRQRSGYRPGARPRHRVPALRAVSVENRARQHSLRPGTAKHAERGTRKARAGFHRAGRPYRLRGQLSLAIVGRHEAAHRDRAHARLRSRKSC